MSSSAGPRLAALAVALVLSGCGSSERPLSPSATETVAGDLGTAAASETATAAASETPGRSESPGRSEPAAAERPLAKIAVELRQVAELESPTAMAVRDGDDRLYVAERGGLVRVLRDGEVSASAALDISDRTTVDGERGLLGIAFSPDGSTLYTSYTDRQGDSRLDAWAMGDGRVDPDSRRELLLVEQPFANHNGGNVVVGPDGLLYLGLGDGGSGGDPLGNGQDLSTLLGSLLRIDPDRGDPYAIPDDNPFVDREGAQPEIYAYGLRNPWRFSFDRETGDLWIADVGQSAVEEINYARAGEAAGDNYGWNRLEGTQPFEGEPPPDAVQPVFEYPTSEGCAVTGGYVYRGSAVAGLQGAYLFSDFCNGRIQALRLRGRRVTDEADLGVQVPEAVSFGEDGDGELYVLSLGGPVYRLVAGG